MHTQHNGNLPLSYFNIGNIAKPANTVGMPITTPENAEVPPRCWAYSFDDDIMIKNDIYKFVSTITTSMSMAFNL